MISALILGLVIGQAGKLAVPNPPLRRPDLGQDPPRLKTVLPNGATVLIEPNLKDPNVNVMLFTGARCVTEPKNGSRHLLEHLVLEGQDGNLDSRLELSECFLSAQTARDFMEIDIACSPKSLMIGLSAISEILSPRTWTQEQISHEAGVVAQEIALEEQSSRLAAATWLVAFKADGWDPIGDPDELAKSNPAELEAARGETFEPANLVLVVEGPVNLREATFDASAVLAKLKQTRVIPPHLRVPVATSGRSVVEGYGDARGVVTPGILKPETAASLAAALAVASLTPDSFVTYTPSVGPAVITLGNTAHRNLIGSTIDGFEPGTADSLFSRGRALAYRWLEKQLSNPLEDAKLRGRLLAQSASARPENLEENIFNLSLAQFQAAMAKLTHDRALVAVGGG